MKRRELLRLLGGASIFPLSAMGNPLDFKPKNKGPLVLSTWHNQGQIANPFAWEILNNNGMAIDAVEAAAKSMESDWENCCVGLGANPDRDGFVTLDASIMNHLGQCGAVAFLEDIKHPISVARAVMEKTPHVLLAGEGARQFALSQGFPIEEKKRSAHADKAYANWLRRSEYSPEINIEQNKHKVMPVPDTLESGEHNHDTIGIIALDAQGNLSGACTTSGMAFKMRGRVGDSPIIGAGLYVDNSVGAATSTGNGEEVIRCSGSFLVVEYMRLGFHPTEACKYACQRLLSITPNKTDNIQIGFIAINKNGEYGAYSLKPGFDYTVSRSDLPHEIRKPSSLLQK